MSALEPQRALQLRFQGDWGSVNLTRICGWLASELGDRAGAGTRSTIRTGRGMGDNLVAVGRNEVDIAVSTPAQFARLARAGKGPFADEAFPGLRAVGTVPHYDALLTALPAGLGIRSFAELREREPALRWVMSPDDGESFMGLGADLVLRASGISPEDLVSWGGELIYRERPDECVAEVVAGRANAIIHEAIMTRWWSDMAEAVDLCFLSLSGDAVEELRSELSLETIKVPAGYLKGMSEDTVAIDFSGWMVVVREDLRDDVAALLATILAETADSFEAQYRHIPVRFSPLDYPITAERLANTPIPLHPGAEGYYRSRDALRSG